MTLYTFYPVPFNVPLPPTRQGDHINSMRGRGEEDHICRIIVGLEGGDVDRQTILETIFKLILMGGGQFVFPPASPECEETNGTVFKVD